MWGGVRQEDFMSAKYTNFGELYRSAFAERDPDRKLELLGEVRRAIDEWEQVIQSRMEKGLPVRHQPQTSVAARNSATRLA